MSIVKHSKYVNALFLGAAALMWLISKHYVREGIAFFQLARYMGQGIDIVEHVLPIVLGVLTFFGLRHSSKSYNFSLDAIAELIQVKWPSEKETWFGTTVVIVTLLLAGVFFGVVDLMFVGIVKILIGV